MGGSGGTSTGRSRPRGNIETLASGSLRVRVYAGTDVLTGRALYLKQVIAAGPAAWEQAEAAREEMVRQVRLGRQPRTNACLRQLLQRHLEVAELGPRAKATLTHLLRKHVEPLLGQHPIGSVNAEGLDSFYATLRRCRDHCDGRSPVLHAVDGPHDCADRCRRHECRPLSAETIRKIHYLLNAAYKNAIRWEWISVNPMDRARKPAPPRPDPQPPTPQEAAALLTEAWRRGFGPLVWVAMTTGARRGEICALRWRHLEVRHTENGSADEAGEHDCVAAGCQWWLVIRRAMGEADDGTLYETDTKGHQRRHVTLDPETVAVLLEHQRAGAQVVEQLGITLTEDSFIFANTPDGTTPSRPSTVSQRYDRCAAKLGIKTSLHKLRHYSATELITAGVDIRTVAGRLGHRDATTTLRIYAAWVAAADQRASLALQQRMPQRPAAPLSGHGRAKLEPRAPYERIAATLWAAWQAGTLAAGTELTANELARTHNVSYSTGHRAITLLSRWGVLRIATGWRSVVLDPGNARSTTLSAPGAVVSASSGTLTPSAETSTDPGPPIGSGRRPLILELVHLGTTVRSMRTVADPEDDEALQRLLADAVRRAGGDPARIAEYELIVRPAGRAEPLATVVIAA